MMTREADYAIRTMVCLAAGPEAGAISSAALARRARIPYRFLRKIVGKLAAAGLIETQRGRQGGIRMLESPSRISVLRIVTTVDPKGTRINACTSSGGCLRRLECPTYPPLRRLQERLDRGLAKLTLDKFVGGRSVK